MATLTEKLNALKAAIAGYTTALKTKAAAKRDFAVLADNAILLGGRTKTQVQANVISATNSHIADTTSNPHGDTPASVGIFDNTEFTAAAGRLIDSGILPLSFYGSPDYLPPVVSGSYEGATSNSGMRGIPLFLEADDTLVYLRSGTTGSINGVYYAFLRNASTATNLKPTYTNIKYAPSYFPSGRTAAYVFPSGQVAISGRLQDASGALQECFISLTNGTFNAGMHTGLLVPGSWEEQLKRASFAVVGGALYIFSPTTNNAGPLGLTVYSIPLSSFTGQTLSGGLTQVTGWTATGLYEVLTGDTIQLSSKTTSNVLSDKPAYLTLNGTEGQYPYFGSAVPGCYAEAQGSKVRVTYQAQWIARYSADYGWVGNALLTYSVDIDTAAKTAVLDNGRLGGQPLITIDRNTASPGQLLISGAGLVTPNQLTGTTQSDCTMAWLVGGNGFEFYYQDNYYPDRNNRLTRRQITNFTSAYAARNFGALPARGAALTTQVVPTYGTAIGGQLRGWTPIAMDRLIVQSQGAKADGSTITGLAMAQIGASGYTYRSVTRGQFSGYAPASPRGMLADLVTSPDWYLNLCSEVTDTSVKATGAILVEGWMLSRFLTVNRDLTTSGTISVTQAQIDTLKAEVFATWQVARGEKQSRMELHIPQDPNCPAYGILHVWTADDIWRMVVFNLTVSSRSGAIATLKSGTLVNGWSSTTTFPTGKFGGWYLDNPEIMGAAGAALTIYKGTDAYLYIARPAAIGLIVGFTQASIDFRMTCGLSDNTLSNDAWRINFNAPQADTTRYGAWPGLGPGYTTHSANSDYYTKLLFAPQGKSRQEFINFAPVDYSNHRVLTSQDVAQGWILYFTQPQPIMLSGVPYTLTAATVDLTSIASNPANRTFYVYVRMIAGTPKYTLSLTELPENEACMFIGTVVTNASAIASITISKVIRLDMIRISTSAVGSAMPVSGGYPSQSGTLTWT